MTHYNFITKLTGETYIYILTTTFCIKDKNFVFELRKINLTEETNAPKQTMAKKRSIKRNALRVALADSHIDLIYWYNGQHQAQMKCNNCGHKWEIVGQRVTQATVCPKCEREARKEALTQKKKEKEQLKANKPKKINAIDRPVRNITTGKIYRSSKEAAKDYDGQPSYIANCCLGKYEKAYKCQWEFSIDTTE